MMPAVKYIELTPNQFSLNISSIFADLWNSILYKTFNNKS